MAVSASAGFVAIEKCLREKTPIVVTPVDFDGTKTTTVLWHPNDPGVPIEIPEAWAPPRGPFQGLWRRFKIWRDSSK